jgi:hypothetical protein
MSAPGNEVKLTAVEQLTALAAEAGMPSLRCLLAVTELG